jgi:CRP-like cAMP-binding protein
MYSVAGMKQVLGPELSANLTAKAAVSTCLTHERDSIVFEQGSTADSFFYILAGLIKIYCRGSGRTRILMNLAGPGDLIGYADFVDRHARRARVFEARALTETSVALISRDYVLGLFQTAAPPMLSDLMQRINTAWASVTYRLGMLLSMSFKERLEFALNELAWKFGLRESRGILIPSELTHTDFAEMIGCSTPMVTRILDEMIEDGVLLHQGNHLIVTEPIGDKSPATIDRLICCVGSSSRPSLSQHSHRT